MKKHGFISLASFLSLNFLLSLLIGLGYFMFVGSHPVEIAFSVTAYLSNTFMIYAALLAVSLVPYFAGTGAAIFIPFAAVIQLILVLDVAIYKIFRFHLNSMVVNLIFTPGGLKSLDQGPGILVLFFGIAAALLAAEFWFYKASVRSAAGNKGIAAILRGRWKSLLAVFLFLVALDKGLFAWGTLYDNVHITSNAKLLPLYQPLKIRTFASKYLGVKLDEEVTVHISKEDSKLDYPKRPLETVPPKKPLNILIIVLDSFRYDMLDKEITPELWAFSKRASVFNDHYSGGNCTRFGIFSIFYGMYGNYWFSMLGERRGPVLMDVLKAQGYEVRLFAGAELSFPEFNKTCFVNVPRENIYDLPKAEGQVGKDIAITEKFLDFAVNRKKDKPYLAFIFYDSSHGSYVYPAGFERFTPAGADVNYLTLNQATILPLFNKYKNSLYFEDSLAGSILKTLERLGGLKDTAVLVMGDHGEAFFEKGYHGHNRAYSAEEVKVPLVFYLPGRAPGVIKAVTSHVDIAPTLMKLAGVRNAPADYSSGKDLFDRSDRAFVTAFSWDTSALIKDNYALVMPLEAYKGGLQLHGPDYKEIPGNQALAPYIPYLLDFQKEAKRFYK
ncbi:MAG: sulfatase-like hydrolase/transferase [Elusimicrobiales bacterium]|jgi:hypothetical protein